MLLERVLLGASLTALRVLLQARTIQNSMADNPLYKAGYMGYTMLKKDGKGFTVPHAKVGKLAREVYEKLKPLVEGPFGAAPKPACKPVKTIILEIREDALERTLPKRALGTIETSQGTVSMGNITVLNEV